MATYHDQLRAHADRFFEETGQKPATRVAMADWVRREGLWKPSLQQLNRILAEDLADALCEDYYVDPQGRHVRTKYAARVLGTEGVQSTLWADIRFRLS